MTDPWNTLRGIPGGRVLDAATGSGGFALLLADRLAGWTEIVGIDTNPKAAAAFEAAAAGRPGIRFETRDALSTGWPDASFDTVAVANSLHHFPDPTALLAELCRLLAPGGTFILSEMHRDTRDPARESHVLLHHWWAEVDRALGVEHRETYGRAELTAFASSLGLEDLGIHDLEEGGDPRDPEALEEVGRAIDAYIARVKGTPDSERLIMRGEELRSRVAETGFLGAPGLLAVGRKRTAPHFPGTNSKSDTTTS